MQRTALRDAGATEEELRTALLRPDINPAMVSEVLGRLREGLWYLRSRDRRYLFTVKPNLNKVILDFEAEVSDEQLEHALREWVEQVAGRGEGVFQVVLAPGEPQLVPDRAQPTLVLLPFDVADAHTWMQQALNSAGGGIRTNKNMLVFLVPDRTRASVLHASVRRWCALKGVERSSSFREMERDDHDQVRQQLKDKEAEIEVLIRQMYQSIYRPEAGGVRPVPVSDPSAIKAKTLGEFVAGVLEKQGELVRELSPEYLSQTLGIGEQKVPVSQVATVFTGTPGQPLVENMERIYESIRQGVEKGIFGIQVGDRIYIREPVPDEVLRNSQAVLVPPGESTLPPEPSSRKPLTLRVRTSASMLYPLLQAARQLLQQLDHATVEIRVHDPTGQMATKRKELEKLLRDYGCTVEWTEPKEAETSEAS